MNPLTQDYEHYKKAKKQKEQSYKLISYINSNSYNTSPNTYSKEVLVKIVINRDKEGIKSPLSGDNVRACLSYIARNGDLKLINENKDELTYNEVFKEYSKDFTNRKNGSDCTHIIFSIKEDNNTNNIDKLKCSIEETLTKEFFIKGYKYVYTIHKDTSNPHVHVVINNANFLNKKRLRILRSDLQNLKEQFAYELTSNGLNYIATNKHDKFYKEQDITYTKNAIKWFESKIDNIEESNIYSLIKSNDMLQYDIKNLQKEKDTLKTTLSKHITKNKEIYKSIKEIEDNRQSLYKPLKEYRDKTNKEIDILKKEKDRVKLLMKRKRYSKAHIKSSLLKSIKAINYNINSKYEQIKNIREPINKDIKVLKTQKGILLNSIKESNQRTNTKDISKQIQEINRTISLKYALIKTNNEKLNSINKEIGSSIKLHKSIIDKEALIKDKSTKESIKALYKRFSKIVGIKADESIKRSNLSLSSNTNLKQLKYLASINIREFKSIKHILDSNRLSKYERILHSNKFKTLQEHSRVINDKFISLKDKEDTKELKESTYRYNKALDELNIDSIKKSIKEYEDKESRKLDINNSRYINIYQSYTEQLKQAIKTKDIKKITHIKEQTDKLKYKIVHLLHNKDIKKELKDQERLFNKSNKGISIQRRL